MAHIDFDALNTALMGHFDSIIQDVCPGGKFDGNEYKAGSIRGGPGTSMSINRNTGKGADFAVNGHSWATLFGYLILLDGMTAPQTATIWADKIGYSNNGHKPIPTKTPARIEREPEHVAPPADAGVPGMGLPSLGEPSMYWTYRSSTGSPMFYIARYETEEGGKEFRPWTWSPTSLDWEPRAWKAPRPLYGLEKLAKMPGRPVCLVEGEKACDAARLIVAGKLVCMTWPGGANAVGKSDFGPIYGREIILWPDADEAGVKAMQKVADILKPHCPSVKIIDVYDGYEEPPDGLGFDAADWEGADWKKFYDWAKTKIKILHPLPVTAPLIVNAVAETVNIQQNVTVQEDARTLPTSVADAVEFCNCAVTGKNKLPICNEDNICRVLEKWPGFKGSIYFDEFHVKLMTNWQGPMREWSDDDTRKMLVYMQREFGFQKIAKTNIKSAVLHFGQQDIRNEPKAWLDSLTWDGVNRIEGFFVNYLGSPSSIYTMQAANNFFIAMAARIYKPGCQVDNMIVLEGKQGNLKTSCLKALGGAWYGASKESFASKDFYLALQGRMIVEIEELGTLLKTTSWEVVKQGVSCTHDRFRPPYGEMVATFPRTCVLVGSTNQDDYLGDLTGNRRFWPMPTGKIDLDRIVSDREQLFAEASVRFKAGDAWWKMPDEAAIEMQESRRPIDGRQPTIEGWLLGKIDTSAIEILQGLYSYDLGDCTIAEQRQIWNILKSLGWVCHRTSKLRRWTRETPRDNRFNLIPDEPD